MRRFSEVDGLLILEMLELDSLSHVWEQSAGGFGGWKVLERATGQPVRYFSDKVIRKMMSDAERDMRVLSQRLMERMGAKETEVPAVDPALPSDPEDRE